MTEDLENKVGFWKKTALGLGLIGLAAFWWDGSRTDEEINSQMMKEKAHQYDRVSVDLDGDRKNDFIWYEYDHLDGSHILKIWLSSISGFNTPIDKGGYSFSDSLDARPREMIIQDLNGDNLIDFAYIAFDPKSENDSAHPWTLYFKIGKRNFRDITFHFDPPIPIGIELPPFGPDQKVFSSSQLPDNCWISGPQKLHFQDVNYDGVLDLLFGMGHDGVDHGYSVNYSGSPKTFMAKGRGDGTFEDAVDYHFNVKMDEKIR
jgi:hypothetical protein